MTGHEVEGARGHGERESLHRPENTRVREPQDKGDEDGKVSLAVCGHRPRHRDGQRDHLSMPTIRSVVSATSIPALRKASSLLLAVPRLPETIAPARPTPLPSRPVRPEITATGFSREPP